MIKLPPFLVVSALFQDTKKPVLAEDSTGVADWDLRCPSQVYITRIEGKLRIKENSIFEDLQDGFESKGQKTTINYKNKE